MYCGVPMMIPVVVSVALGSPSVAAPTAFAIPKSMTRTRLSRPSSMMFSGLMSRWMTPASCGAESECGFAQDAPHLRCWHRPVAIEHRAQAFAGDHRHDDEGEPFGLADVVHRDDVRVAQRRDGFGFAAESLQQVGRETEIGAKHLHGEIALEPEVTGVEHLGEAAGADAILQLVAGPQRPLQLPQQVRRTDP